jgi:hypothetical protein
MSKFKGCHDTQHNDTQHNGTEDKGLICNTQHNDTQHYGTEDKGLICNTQHKWGCLKFPHFVPAELEHIFISICDVFSPKKLSVIF